MREDETLAYLNGQFARLGADLNLRSLVQQLRDNSMIIMCGGGRILGTKADATPAIPVRGGPASASLSQHRAYPRVERVLTTRSPHRALKVTDAPPTLWEAPAAGRGPAR